VERGAGDGGTRSIEDMGEGEQRESPLKREFTGGGGWKDSFERGS